jgi:hypothetical protein
MGRRERDHDRVFWGKAEIGKAEIGKSGFLLSARAKGATLLCCSNLPLSAFPADGGGIPHPASNPSILYLLSMLYDSIAASMPFSARLAIFEEKQPKRLAMNDLRAKRHFSNQAQSRLIKLLFTRFCHKSITPILQHSTGLFPFCGPKPVPMRANGVPSAFLNWP